MCFHNGLARYSVSLAWTFTAHYWLNNDYDKALFTGRRFSLFCCMLCVVTMISGLTNTCIYQKQQALKICRVLDFPERSKNVRGFSHS